MKPYEGGVNGKGTVGSEEKAASVVIRCEQYRSIFTKVLGRVEYSLVVTEPTVGLKEMRPPVTEIGTPKLLRKRVVLT
jgi:hypothetical protein